MKFKLSLEQKIMSATIMGIITCLLGAGIFAWINLERTVEAEIGNRTLSIAKTVATMDLIKDNVGKAGGEQIIQPLVEQIRTSTQVEFIVVMDMNSIRYSHPVKERIGKPFSGDDQGPALKGEAYTSKSMGTLGYSLRAFAPIYRDHHQVGAVAVGILIPEVNMKLREIRNILLAGLLIGLLIGIPGSSYFAKNIKSTIFGLEPEEIARMFTERKAIMDSIKEGIVAVDADNNLTLFNSRAKEMLHLEESDIGTQFSNINPRSGFATVLKTTTPQFNQECVVNDNVFIVNRVPVIVNSQIIGAVASFNEKNEVAYLAEKLTGIQRYVEALRVQHHEFSNKLHTISGLIQLKCYDEAVEFIQGAIQQQKLISGMVSKQIKESTVAALLIGKIGRAKELGIKFIIDEESFLEDVKNEPLRQALVTIIGNLIDNSFDAVVQVEHGQVEVGIFQSDSVIELVVIDNGMGMDNDIKGKICRQGFTTKEGHDRGYGLSLVCQNIKNFEGKMDVNSQLGQGAEFVVKIPLKRSMEV